MAKTLTLTAPAASRRRTSAKADLLPFLHQVERIDILPKSPGRVAMLSPDEARTLTTNIRHAAVKLWVLVAEAHDRGAWSALGYDTWRDYVVGELQMSESTSYNYLDQARIMRELVTAGVDINDIEPPPVRVVQRIKDNLPGVRKAARKALEDGVSVEEALRELAEQLKPHREPIPRSSSRVIQGTVIREPETPPGPATPVTQGPEAPIIPLPSEPRAEPTTPPAPQVTFSAEDRVEAVKAEMPRGDVLCPACGGTGSVKRKLANALKPALEALRL